MTFFPAINKFHMNKILKSMRHADQETYCWWTIDCLNLMDEKTGEHSFTAHYHIIKSTFEILVNALRNTAAYARSDREQDNVCSVSSSNTDLNHLKDVVGAIDDKLIQIQKPSIDGSFCDARVFKLGQLMTLFSSRGTTLLQATQGRRERRVTRATRVARPERVITETREVIAAFITSCCILHNLYIDNGDYITANPKDDADIYRFLDIYVNDEISLSVGPLNDTDVSQHFISNDFPTELSLNNCLRQLKEHGKIKRNEVMYSL
ncbi:hypothetical protein PHYBLDRAFT_165406 [Phycomyces blakesleeanus NRRL 1555(-)]|uniref:DDE Tnp4 domain-containing protein n=1 Tax=Phycomyces blakesleeanus (strain ATCC 8743b / DSM 1359 / FGSC 10004 / NBRC 33097 / NRRL 1555) TaxID=763407 RepID=A0A167NYY8_PHYB8|nr:hypothetical protein PHYBLDRAFT_165406 [Phycomyces blakesleeanus NRRL 1555(-)]OAD76908.1 hypothetical protein PHYBLDRAFT_165406 [Phycomyces blakesleeanus NRRL 1555(-)]|eukprot:XP_018294948.1 hypothetical protein PHYBLDRAFT_165406 [Phycomyces blakesleeanus NRRL 1555(-)]